MRNEYIKFCDKHSIKDGVLREFLTNGNHRAALLCVKEAIDKRKQDIFFLEELEGTILKNIREEYILPEDDEEKEEKS